MQPADLLELIDKGEDSRTQFKRDINNVVQLAQEMVAFSNSKGGFIIVGVNDAGLITGLDSNDIRRLNQLISNGVTNPTALWKASILLKSDQIREKYHRKN
jgi:predicted HTH transcriptional regulator